MDPLELFTVKDLARILHKSPVTVRDAASKRPHLLPPRVAIPGGRPLLWRRVDVEAWIARHVERVAPVSRSVAVSELKRRGRPRKSEQISRRSRGEA